MRSHFHQLYSKFRLTHTYVWALLMSCLIVGIAATLARATLNLASALVKKPDIAVLLLLGEKDLDVSDSVLVRTTPVERDYYVQTDEGAKLARLKKGEKQWYVQEVIPLHE